MFGAEGGLVSERNRPMSARPPVAKPRAAKLSPAVTYHAEERALLRDVPLRALTALEQMYAYYGTDRS